MRKHAFVSTTNIQLWLFLQLQLALHDISEPQHIKHVTFFSADNNLVQLQKGRTWISTQQREYKAADSSLLAGDA